MTARGLRRADPMASLFLLLCLVGAALAAQTVIVPLVELAVIVALSAASGERADKLVPLRWFVFFFALVLFVAQALSVQSGAVVVVRPVQITADGLLSGAGMAARFLVILLSSALFVRTTDPDRLADAFVRFRTPYRYAYLPILALRFVPFFQEELQAVRDAQRVRGIQVSVRTPRKILRAVRYTFLPVLVSGLYRAEAIAISMRSRCFGLAATRTARRPEAWSAWCAVAFFAGLAVVGWVVATRVGGWSG
jgi:energy-coupling factor transport system permease protein